MEKFRSIKKINLDRFEELRKKKMSCEEKEEFDALIWYLSICDFPLKRKPIITAAV